jgi:hypothetical protein
MMTEIKTFKCDSCGIEYKSNNGLCGDVVLTIPPLASYGNDTVYRYNHLCEYCREKLIRSIEAAVPYFEDR